MPSSDGPDPPQNPIYFTTTVKVIKPPFSLYNFELNGSNSVIAHLTETQLFKLAATVQTLWFKGHFPPKNDINDCILTLPHQAVKSRSAGALLASTS